MEKQLNEIDGEMKMCVGGRGGVDLPGGACLLPPGGTNVSFEQFVDSPLSSWPGPLQTASIFWTPGTRRVDAVASKRHGLADAAYCCARGYRG